MSGNKSFVPFRSINAANAPSPDPGVSVTTRGSPPSKPKIPSSHRLVHGLTRYLHSARNRYASAHPDVSVSSGPPPLPSTIISNTGWRAMLRCRSTDTLVGEYPRYRYRQSRIKVQVGYPPVDRSGAGQSETETTALACKTVGERSRPKTQGGGGFAT